MRWGYQLWSGGQKRAFDDQIPGYAPTPGQWHTFRLELNFDNFGIKRWEFWIDNILVKTNYNWTFPIGNYADVGLETNFAGTQYEPQLWSQIATRNAAGTWINASGSTIYELHPVDGYRVMAPYNTGGTDMAPCMNDPVAHRC